MNYQMTPISAGTRLRIDHNTFAKVITSYGTTHLVQGDILWEAPADGSEVKKGDKWLHVTHVNGVQLEESGWMAYIHKGVPVCKDFHEVTDTTPPPPVDKPEFADSFILTNPDGEQAFYQFVRKL